MTANEVDAAHSLPAGEVGAALLALREDQWFDRKGPRIDANVAARLPVGSQLVLDVMRGAESPLGTGQLAELLDLSRPTVLSRLRALEDEGLVEWAGKSKKDPRATWALKDH